MAVYVYVSSDKIVRPRICIDPMHVHYIIHNSLCSYTPNSQVSGCIRSAFYCHLQS